MIAQKQRDFDAAEKWYRKSLAIDEKQGNEHGAAAAYHQLGRAAEEQRDFVGAQEWYGKALRIYQKLDDKHNAGIVERSMRRSVQQRNGGGPDADDDGG